MSASRIAQTCFDQVLVAISIVGLLSSQQSGWAKLATT